MGTHEEPDTSMYWNSDFNKIEVLYTQFRAIYPYADISKSSDIAIYRALKAIKVQATTYLLIKRSSPFSIKRLSQ